VWFKRNARSVSGDESRSRAHARTRKIASSPIGFTLIELLVVIAIIATLAAVVAPAVFHHVSDAKTEAAKSQIEIFSLALDSYRLDNDTYPTTEQGLSALRTIPQAGSPPRNWRGPYLRKEVPMDPWGRAYVYTAPGKSNPASYDCYTLGRDGKVGGEGEDADITSWGGAVTQ
jgi:general secretion pathway protein G